MNAKTKSKALLLTLCAAILVTATVIGTLAYLTSQSTAVNEFTVGNVSIVVDETKVNSDGSADTTATARVDHNDYHLIPGKKYLKDPRVTVKAGSEESYVRMLVTINNLADLKAIFGADFLPQYYVEGWDAQTWIPNGLTENSDDTVTYEFRYKSTVDASEATADIILPELFTHFTLDGKVTGEQLALINDLKITAEGHAIQAYGFESADAAWAAFDQQVKK